MKINGKALTTGKTFDVISSTQKKAYLNLLNYKCNQLENWEKSCGDKTRKENNYVYTPFLTWN